MHRSTFADNSKIVDPLLACTASGSWGKLCGYSSLAKEFFDTRIDWWCHPGLVLGFACSSTFTVTAVMLLIAPVTGFANGRGNAVRGGSPPIVPEFVTTVDFRGVVETAGLRALGWKPTVGVEGCKGLWAEVRSWGCIVLGVGRAEAAKAEGVLAIALACCRAAAAVVLG